jgi:hypothetical protein
MKRQTSLIVALATVSALILGSLGYATANGSGNASVLQMTSGPNPRPQPLYDPAQFTTHVDNPWFPLKPDIVYVYRGTEEGDRLRDVFRITNRTKSIAGVTCRVIKDKVYVNGVLRERTFDYYTQNIDGNVWYFGEDTAELDKNGDVKTTEGTWRTGRDGAEAGIFMEANPQVGHTFQQELLRGHAEDHFEVLSLNAEIKVPYGHFGRNPLRRSVQLTKEWSPLEPDVRDHKYYVRGIGQVMEKTVRGGDETLRLVRILKR